MIIIDEPNIPHKKKKNSDISKASKKSKHKHIYNKVVIFECNKGFLINGTWNIGMSYCSICGKIGDMIETKFPWGCDRTKEEWLEKYPNAIWVKLEEEKSWFNIDNINEVL